MALNKPLDSITEKDLQELVGKVPERKMIEYKLSLPGNSDSERKEFLADVSSFANAAGGDLLYGIRAESGTPVEVRGVVEGIDLDAKKLNLENMIRDGIRPRCRVKIEGITLSSGAAVLIIRVPKSWASPHMVIFGNHAKFYSRNSAGKYQLDVDELRAAFLISETRAERIRNFRADRLGKIVADEVPISSDGPERLVIHIVPIGSFDPGANMDLSPLLADPAFHIGPISGTAGSVQRINFDGFFVQGRKSKPGSIVPCSYLQVYRNGTIEAVDADYLSRGRDDRLIAGGFEEMLLEKLKNYLSVQQRLGVQPPIFVMLSLLGVLGYEMCVPPEYGFGTHPIDRDALILSEIMIESFDHDLAQEMKPAFDQIWNAAGWPGSISYDKNGRWIRC
jgi:hypothetical protein